MCNCDIGRKVLEIEWMNESLYLGLSRTCFELWGIGFMSSELATFSSRFVLSLSRFFVIDHLDFRCSYVSIESLGWSSCLECRFLSNSERHNCQWYVRQGQYISLSFSICLFRRNELEREYVQLLQFNVNVASSIYAKYYFDLRQIANENQISFPDELLTKEKAIKLEVNFHIEKKTESMFSRSILRLYR